MGLLEPINTRITDPRYFLDTPQHGRLPAASCPVSFCVLVSQPLWASPQLQPSYRRLEDPTSNYRW